MWIPSYSTLNDEARTHSTKCDPKTLKLFHAHINRSLKHDTTTAITTCLYYNETDIEAKLSSPAKHMILVT